jgi:hypothetical protein
MHVPKDREIVECPDFKEKLRFLTKEKYDEVLWVLCEMKYAKKYRRLDFGVVSSRTRISEVIRKYFEPDDSTLSKVVEGIKGVVSPGRKD